MLPSLTALPVGLLKAFFLNAEPFPEFHLRAPGQAWAHRNEIIALDAAPMTDDPSTPPVLFSGVFVRHSLPALFFLSLRHAYWVVE